MLKTYSRTKLSPEKLKTLAIKLYQGEISVMPSDTIYGIFTSAFSPSSIEKIYQLRKRNPEKPMIILINSIEDLSKFDISLTKKIETALEKFWPGPVSVVLDCNNKKFEYLHRGTNTLAFRIPNDNFLLSILKKSGPLVAPSANIEGEKPSLTIDEAKKYFSGQINFYIDGGFQKGKPSTVLKIKDSSLTVLREGAFQISDIKL